MSFPRDGFGPLTPAKVEEMGLAVDEQECTVQHRPGMKPHYHIALPRSYYEPPEPPMTITVDLEDNPTLVGWVMNDE